MKNPYAATTGATLSLLALLGARPASAQYVFTDSNLTPYTQNFDAMAGTVPFSFGTTALPSMVGVYAEAQADPQFGNGSLFPANVPANDGSVVSGAYYHFGQPDDTDRAFGGIAETGVYTGKGYVGIRLKNGSSVPIENLEIQYAMEQWYNSGNEAAAFVNVSYRKSSGVSGENFASLNSAAVGDAWTPVPALTVPAPSTGTVIQSRDGNSAANRRVVQTSLMGVHIAPGQEIMIRWDYVLNPTTNGNGVSIDDVIITPQTSVYFAQGEALLRGGQQGSSTAALLWQDANGTAPATLDAPNRTYYVKGAVNAASLTAITGANTKIIIGVPASSGLPAEPGELRLTDNTVPAVPLDVSGGSTLRLEEGAASIPTLNLGLLAPASTVVYESVAATHTIQPASYGQLVLSGAGPKTLGGSILVAGNLQLSSAQLTLGDFNATLLKGGRVTGSTPTAYIRTTGNGRLHQSVLSDNAEVLFPVGTATAYLPITLRQSAARSEDVFAVRAADEKFATYQGSDVGEGAALTVTKGVRKTWLVSEEVAGNVNLTLQMQWKDTEQSADFEPAKAYISHYHNGFWDRTTPAGATLVSGLTDTYTLSRSAITSLSPFTVSSDVAQPLPVELVSFAARRTATGVVCNWVTASETNSHSFTLERSLTGQSFTTIGTLKSAGTTTLSRAYSLPDPQPAAATAYYRLRQTDTDGKVAYSHTVVVQGSGTSLAISAAPNPSNGPFSILLTAAAATTIQATVTSVTGRQVLRLAQPVPAGFQTLPIDLSGQPAGVYLLRIQTPQGMQTLRLMKR